MPLSQFGCVPDGVVPSLEDHKKQKYIIENVSVVENTFQGVFSCKEVECNLAIKNYFIINEGKEKKTLLLQLERYDLCSL